MKKYSIIVPIYNVEKYLDKCLNSILNQTYQNFEVICVNDGTLDNSQSIVDNYVKLDQRFKSFIKENGGLGDARNYGLTKASYDYIIFIDSDDFMELNLIEEVNNNIGDNDILMFDFYQYNVLTHTKELITLNYQDKTLLNINDNPEIISSINNCAWNKCYKRSLFNDIEYPKRDLYEDLGTTYKLIDQAKSIIYHKIPLINYLVNRDGNITTHISSRMYDIFKMSSINLEYFNSHANYIIIKPYLNQLLYDNIVQSIINLIDYKDYKFTKVFIEHSFQYIRTHIDMKDVKSSSIIYRYEILCKLYLLCYRRIKTKWQR